MNKMTLSVMILASCWLLGDATVTQKSYTYEDIDLSDKIFTDNTTFKSSAKHELDCARQCSQRDSCVTFTFHGNTCRGHDALMTSNSNFSPISEARSYSRNSRCEKTGVTRMIDPSLGLDVNVSCQDDWMVFQKRQDGSVDFFRDWDEYSTGFGDVNGEYWLGLDTMHRITTSGVTYDLRVDLVRGDGSSRSALYYNFSVGSAADNYTLHYARFLNGTLGDALFVNRGKPFSTWDVDNDDSPQNCAVKSQGAWWYSTIDCSLSNLNGYYWPGMVRPPGVDWDLQWTSYQAMSCQMMVRPANWTQ